MSTYLLVSSSVTLIIIALLVWQVLNLRRLPEWITVWIKVPILASAVLISVVTLIFQSLMLLVFIRIFG